MYFLFISAIILTTNSAIVVSTVKAKYSDNISTSIEGRITNGNNATLGQIPFQVGIYSYEPGNWCGGSLIHSEWILTAAHCLVYTDYAEIYLGSIYYRRANVTRFVSKSDIVIHPGFNKTNYKDDIALIKIAPVTLRDEINIIKLPSIFAKSHSTYEGKSAIASGWGRVSDKSKKPPTILQWARFQVMSFGDCLKRHPIIHFSSLCVSTPNDLSPCFGDSGGPLVSESDNLLIGVFSFLDLPGCEYGIPAGFARVTNFLDWIYYHTGIKY